MEKWANGFPKWSHMLLCFLLCWGNSDRGSSNSVNREKPYKIKKKLHAIQHSPYTSLFSKKNTRNGFKRHDPTLSWECSFSILLLTSGPKGTKSVKIVAQGSQKNVKMQPKGFKSVRKWRPIVNQSSK